LTIAESQTTTDHAEIRKWVESRQGHPARVKGTEDSSGEGLLRVNVAALGHATGSGEDVKNTFANFAFEHVEIASYKSLLTLADLAGHSAGAAR
jgi:ferritin-like metal-binding protein YciE